MDKLVGQKRRADRRKMLCQELATTIKMIQEDHVITKQVKGTHFAANQLCDLLEAIFLHELKDKRGNLWREKHNPNSVDLPEPSFWSCIDPLVSDEIKIQLLALRNSDSDIKKCRSWIRLMLVKGLLVSFLGDVQKHPGLLGPHYGPDSVLKDPECAEIINQLLRGLQVFEFEYDFSSTRLLSWDASVLQLAGIWNPAATDSSQSHRLLKKKFSKSNSSLTEERISPPPSDFLMEEAVVGPALDRYSTFKKSMDNLTDSELLHLEEQEEPKSDPGRSKLNQTGDRSFSTLLHSYADKINKPTLTTYGYRFEVSTQRKPEAVGGVAINEEEEVVDIVLDDLTLAQSMNFEIINEEDSMTPKIKEHIDTLTAHLTKLGVEQGLDSQNYECSSCRRPIGIVFGEAKLCKYDGNYYCFECHLDEEREIPSRMLMNWDFRKHRVCIRSAEFLDSIETMPVLNVEETNKALYHYIPELEDTRRLRYILSLQKDYILTCKDTNFVDEFKKRVRSSHFYEHVHFYSVKDLKQVYTRSLVNRLKKVVKNSTKHIRQCPICTQKGFICEVCQKDEILFPFDEETYQCEDCRSVYHFDCRPKLKSDCPKCLRLEQRRASIKRLDNNT